MRHWWWRAAGQRGLADRGDDTPGAALVEVAAALAPVVGATASDVLVRLEADRRGLADLARDTVPPEAQLAVVVDQVEELFTQTRDAGERQQFVASLTRALDEVGGRVTAVLALRGDFYGHRRATPNSPPGSTGAAPCCAR